MGKALSYEVGEEGRFQGTIVKKFASGRYVEVLAYGGDHLGECQVYVYELGPRGGVNVLEGHTTPQRLRTKARNLELYADEVERYVAKVVADHG